MKTKYKPKEHVPLDPKDLEAVESARKAIDRHLKRRNKRDADYQKKFGKKK